MRDTPSYIKVDTTAMDREVERHRARQRESQRKAHARSFLDFGKGGSLLLLGGGGAIALVLYGVSLFTEPRVITREVVVEKPVAFEPKIHVDLGRYAYPLPQDKLKEARDQVARQDAVDATTATSAPPVFNYVLFADIPFDRDGFLSVTVGMRFADTDTRTPMNQWCYLSKAQGTTGAARQISLATKEGGEASLSPVTPDMAAEGTTTVEVIRAAQALCRFL